jgi:hypothetical protein
LQDYSNGTGDKTVRVTAYICVWESQYGASLMITGKNAIDEQTAEKNNN